MVNLTGLAFWKDTARKVYAIESDPMKNDVVIIKDEEYEGSYAPKSYFKFCFEDPVYFIYLMEQNLGNQNRNWSNRIEIKETEIGATEQKLKWQNGI